MPHFYFLFLILLVGSQKLNGQEHRAEFFTYGGLPTGKDVQVLYNLGFITGYSNTLKNPLWTCYRLGNAKGRYQETDREKLVKWQRPRSFKVDHRTTAKVSHDDYTGSGFQRGHMAPDAAIQAQYGQLALLDTYLMSNISPQHGDLNQGIWEELESYVRKTLSQDDTQDKEIHDVFVITGPIFTEGQTEILDSGVPVPTHFYKIFAYKRGYYGGVIKAASFVFPQHPQSDEFMDYVKSVDEIEQLTGLDFFSDLSNIKQRNLESKTRDFRLEEVGN